MTSAKAYIIILAPVFLLQSCKEKSNNKIAEPVKPLKTITDNTTFYFSDNEQKLFEPGDAQVVVNLDTVNTIGQLAQVNGTIPYEKTVARSFTYPDGSSSPKVFHAVYKKDRSHSWVADAKKSLFIEIPDTATIVSYA